MRNRKARSPQSDGIPLYQQDGAASAATALLVVAALIVCQPKAAADLDVVDQVLHGGRLVPLPIVDDAGELGVRHVADKVEGEVHDGHDAQPRRRQQRAQIHTTSLRL